MDLWTIQLSKGRKAEAAGIPVLNTTVKNGDKVFAPTWEIVLSVKNGSITPLQYTEVYNQLMRDSYNRHRGRWIEVCSMPIVAVSCFCPDGKFCHRHLLADMFIRVCNKHGLPVRHLGEWQLNN